MKNLMENLKKNKAFTIMELLIVIAVLAILITIIPNLNLFVENAAKKEGVQLVRAIIEQERVYKADNGDYFIPKNANDADAYESLQNWKTIKTLLLDNNYFKPEKVKKNNNKIEIEWAGNDNEPENFNKVIVEVSSTNKTNCNLSNNYQKCKLEVEVKASPKSKAKGWHIRGHLIEVTEDGYKEKKVKDKKNKKEVVSKIIFKDIKEDENGSIPDNNAWQEIAL